MKKIWITALCISLGFFQAEADQKSSVDRQYLCYFDAIGGLDGFLIAQQVQNQDIEIPVFKLPDALSAQPENTQKTEHVRFSLFF